MGEIEPMHRVLKAALRCKYSVDWTTALPFIILDIHTSIRDNAYSAAKMTYGTSLAFFQLICDHPRDLLSISGYYIHWPSMWPLICIQLILDFTLLIHQQLANNAVGDLRFGFLHNCIRQFFQCLTFLFKWFTLCCAHPQSIKQTPDFPQ